MALSAPRTVCSLFAGGGGLDLGIHAATGARSVVYVEREAFAAACLVARMEEAALAPAPIWDDVSTFDGRPWRGVVDLVAGGSPCQDLSVAGRRAGLDGERSGLFFRYVEIVNEIRPRFLFWENVGGAASALPRVFGSLEEIGYRGAWCRLRASDVGASHQRARIFVLAYRNGGEGGDEPGRKRRENGTSPTLSGHHGGAVAHADPLRQQQPQGGLSDVGGWTGDGGARVADASGVGREQWGPKSAGLAGRPCVAVPSGPMAHGHGHGLEGKHVHRPAPGPTLRGDPPLPFPPSPGDAGAWRAILAERPDLAPAQPILRGVADGVADWVDRSRADRLRVLGNGVVPAQAAAAWRLLWRAIGGEG